MKETTFCCSRISKETKATTFQKQKNMSQLTVNLLALTGMFPIFPASFELLLTCLTSNLEGILLSSKTVLNSIDSIELIVLRAP